MTLRNDSDRALCAETLRILGGPGSGPHEGSMQTKTHAVIQFSNSWRVVTKRKDKHMPTNLGPAYATKEEAMSAMHGIPKDGK